MHIMLKVHIELGNTNWILAAFLSILNYVQASSQVYFTLKSQQT